MTPATAPGVADHVWDRDDIARAVLLGGRERVGMDRLLVVGVQKVTQVLLQDGWHFVKRGSFTVADLSFVGGDGRTVIGPSSSAEILAAQWTDQDDSVVVAPVTAIHAIRSN